MNFKQQVREREDIFLSLAVGVLVCLYLTPKEQIIMTEVYSVLLFGLLSLYYWAITPSFIHLVIWRGLYVLNVFMFIIHSILLFLVLFIQV